jgi:hypothetical protein
MAAIERTALQVRLLGLLPLAFSGLALVISFFSYQLTAVRNVKPVLTIAYRGSSGWYVKNIGNGPALNVVVAEKGQGDWFKPVRIPALANSEEHALRWLGQTNIESIGATYFDIDGRQYTSLTEQDLTTIKTGNRMAKWQERDIEKEWELALTER